MGKLGGEVVGGGYAHKKGDRYVLVCIGICMCIRMAEGKRVGYLQRQWSDGDCMHV